VLCIRTEGGGHPLGGTCRKGVLNLQPTGGQATAKLGGISFIITRTLLNRHREGVGLPRSNVKKNTKIGYVSIIFK
jgi:hypothetical protein